MGDPADRHGLVCQTGELMARRTLFAISVTALGLSLGDAATRLGVSYYHLMLVLDGHRSGSARLKSGISTIIQDAQPILFAALQQDDRRTE